MRKHWTKRRRNQKEKNGKEWISKVSNPTIIFIPDDNNDDCNITNEEENVCDDSEEQILYVYNNVRSKRHYNLKDHNYTQEEYNNSKKQSLSENRYIQTDPIRGKIIDFWIYLDEVKIVTKEVIKKVKEESQSKLSKLFIEKLHIYQEFYDEISKLY